VEDQIRTEPNSSMEDRRQMMEMLKRLEDHSYDDGITERDTEDAEDGDLSLSGRLAHLSIGKHCHLPLLQTSIFFNHY
jgi:hypothetical protein